MEIEDPPIISIDLETYGAYHVSAAGKPLPIQRLFHPRRSIAHDNVPVEDLIGTCSITTVQNDPRKDAKAARAAALARCSGSRGPLKGTSTPELAWSAVELAQLQPRDTFVCQMHIKSHREILIHWLRYADTLLFMNMQFDTLYSRILSQLRTQLNGRHFVIDLSVINKEQDDVRPEKSLKNIGPVTSAYSYEGVKTLAEGHRFGSPRDPDLHKYNGMDTHNTILGISHLARLVVQEKMACPNTTMTAVVKNGSSELTTSTLKGTWPTSSPSSASGSTGSLFTHSAGNKSPSATAARRSPRQPERNDKLSYEAMDYYNWIFWSCIRMSEDGIPINRDKLLALHKHTTARAELCAHILKEHYGLNVVGTGSDQPRRDFIEETLQYLNKTRDIEGLMGVESILDHDLVHYTKEEAKMGYGEENRALCTVLLGYDPQPKELRLRRMFRLWNRQSKCQKLVSSYTNSLLYRKRSKTNKRPFEDKLIAPPRTCWGEWRLQVYLAYPSIYVVPSSVKDTSNVMGGQKQARLAFKGPAGQTFPPLVKKCIESRFRRGYIVGYDLSQIELRTAALVSGDESMVRNYVEGRDLHSDRAIFDFGEDIVNDPNWKSGDGAKDPRQWSKRGNFEDQYLAGAATKQQMMLVEARVLKPLAHFEELVERRRSLRPGLGDWQDLQVARALRDNRSEILPITGQSRTFIQEKKPNEIVNFPIQAIAANVMIYVQIEMHKRLEPLNHRKRLIRMFLNWYDALLFDVREDQLERCDKLFAECFDHVINVGYWRQLENHYGRRIPVKYDRSIYYSPD